MTKALNPSREVLIITKTITVKDEMDEEVWTARYDYEIDADGIPVARTLDNATLTQSEESQVRAIIKNKMRAQAKAKEGI